MNLKKVLAGFAFLVASMNAAAVVVIDFGTGLAGSGGTIVNTGSTITGTDIKIGSMEVQGTTSSDGTYIADAKLNFNTSANTISITGDISSLGIFNEVLLSGSFDTFSYSVYPGPTEVFDASGPDTKSSNLLSMLGIPLNTAFGFFGFTIESANGSVTSTDIINTAVVPVPAALWLFGSGLLGMVAVGRRRS